MVATTGSYTICALVRILVTYPFPLGRATGGARMTREIARHLGRAGAVVTLLPVSGTPASAWPRPALDRASFGDALAADLDVRHVAPHPLHWALDGRAVARAVAEILDRETVDVVLSYYHEGAFLGRLLARHGVPHGYLATWQSYARAFAEPLPQIPRRLAPAVLRRLVVWPHRRARVLFATSEFTRNELVDLLGVAPERIELCRLGVAARFFAIPRRGPEAVRRLLFFGRLVPHKGVEDLLSALGTLARDGRDDWQLQMVGQGRLDWARQLAARHGIGARVQIVGPADDDGVCRALEAAQLAILPSHFEAFGLAFAEAQAAGLPVVGYRAGSVPEIVQHGVTGWLAPAHDEAQLTAVLRDALARPERTHAAGLAARRRARDRFCWARTADTILRRVRAL